MMIPDTPSISKSRRRFLQHTLWAGAAGVMVRSRGATQEQQAFQPGIIATWDHGKMAVDHGARMLREGAGALDIVEAGVNEVENDPSVTSVGYGGFPDETGEV